MKLVKKFAVAVLFVSVLAVPTFAGDMNTPGKSDPPPPPGNATATAGTTGITSADGTTSDTDSSFQLLYEAYRAMLGLY